MSGHTKPVREIGARVTHSVAQAVVTSTPTRLNLDTTRRANGVTVGTNKLTVTEPGWYVIFGSIEWAAVAGGLRTIAIVLNAGATPLAGNASTTIGAGLVMAQSVSTVYYLNTGDFVQLQAYQDSGGSVNVNATGNYSPELAVMKLPGTP